MSVDRQSLKRTGLSLILPLVPSPTLCMDSLLGFSALKHKGDV